MTLNTQKVDLKDSTNQPKSQVEFKQKPKKLLGIGRRKSSTCQVLIQPNGQGNVRINKRPCADYMRKNAHLLLTINQPLAFLDLENQLDLNIEVKGGGLQSQADAIQLGLARALCVWDEKYRSSLKLKGLLRRDARVKERKKYGLKKARKAPQYSKR